MKRADKAYFLRHISINQEGHKTLGRDNICNVIWILLEYQEHITLKTLRKIISDNGYEDQSNCLSHLRKQPALCALLLGNDW